MPRNKLTQDDIPNNTGAFLNDLFIEEVRSSEQLVKDIREAASHNQHEIWLIDDDEKQLIIGELAGQLLQEQSSLGPEDQLLMSFFREYFLKNELAMSVPKLVYDGLTETKRPRFRIKGYTTYDLVNDNGSFNKAGVTRFLELLLVGAHFVVLHAIRDMGGSVQNFYYTFKEHLYRRSPFSGLSAGTSFSGTAFGHSHYKAKGPSVGTALAFPSKWEWFGWKAAQKWPLVPILITDTTAWSWGGARDHNSFFQMEGWSTSILASVFARAFPNTVAMLGPLAGSYLTASYNFIPASLLLAKQLWETPLMGPSLVEKGGVRHGADFTTHEQTKYNLSTYGACVYSEKRGATVFLHWRECPPPKRSSDTIMASYVGAEKRQGWLDTSLIRY